MYSDDELHFIEEGLFIQSLLDNAPLESRAGALDFITGSLGELGNSVNGFVQQNLQQPTGTDFVAHILNLFVVYALSRRNILYGLLYAIASAMGFDLTGIIKSLVNGVVGLLRGNKQISASDVDSVGTSLITSHGGDYAEADDTIRNIAAYQTMLKRYGASGLLRRLGGRRVFALVVRIMGWILKAFLASAGLMIGGKMIADFLGISKKEPTPGSPEAADQKEPGSTEPVNSYVPASPPGLNPSGTGTTYHVNDQYTSWIVPLQGSIADTLVNWATEIYPQLQGKEDLIRSAPSFNIMVNKLKEGNSSSNSSYLMMPKGVHRRIDIVNDFAGDVAKKLNQGQEA